MGKGQNDGRGGNRHLILLAKGEALLCAKDVCDALGYKQTHKGSGKAC